MEEKMKYSTRQQKIILECLQEYGDTFYTIDQFMELLRGKEIQIGRTTVYRGLERLQKEGEEGRKKIGTITRFVTVGLGLLQSLAYFFFLRANGYLMKYGKLVCLECGHTIPLQCGCIDHFVGHVLDEHGFEIDQSRTIFYGYCDSCRRLKK